MIGGTWVSTWGEDSQEKGKYLVNICTVACKLKKCYFSVKSRLSTKIKVTAIFPLITNYCELQQICIEGIKNLISEACKLFLSQFLRKTFSSLPQYLPSLKKTKSKFQFIHHPEWCKKHGRVYFYNMSLQFSNSIK